MREIEFRGKRLDNGEWVEGCLTRYSRLMSYITEDLIENKVHQVSTKTVGQFTGLFDKNGNDIYECDISIDKVGRNHIVEYHHGGCWLNSFGSGYTERLHADRQIEIFGNIHDNPELLKSE